MQAQQVDTEVVSQKVAQSCVEAMRRMQKQAETSAKAKGLDDCSVMVALVKGAMQFACEVAIEHEKRNHDYEDESAAIQLCISLGQLLGQTFQDLHADLTVPKSQYDS